LAEARLGEELENSLRSLQKVSTGSSQIIEMLQLLSVDAI
jgi:hypothetical protein